MSDFQLAFASDADPRPPVTAPNVELACTREAAHGHYSVPPDALPYLRGMMCPTCRIGMLDLTQPARARMAPAPMADRESSLR